MVEPESKWTYRRSPDDLGLSFNHSLGCYWAVTSPQDVAWLLAANPFQTARQLPLAFFPPGLPRISAHPHAVGLLHIEMLHIFALRELVHLVVFSRKCPDIPALELLTHSYHDYYYYVTPIG